MKRKMAIMLGAMILSYGQYSYGQKLPDSIEEYLKVKDKIPQINLDGLSTCRLLERASKMPKKEREKGFYALPTDVGEENCDLSKVILAYNGWCTAGVEDSRGVHFSKSYLPHVRMIEYNEGITVIYLNNYLKTGVTPSAEDRKVATEFFKDIPSEFDIRGEDRPIFPKEYEGELPPKKK